MLEGMEHVKCCGNCINYLNLSKKCSLNNYINEISPEFNWCISFEVDEREFVECTSETNLGLPNKPTKVPMPPVKPPKKSIEDKEKLIHNMARYIARQDIDSEVCIPLIREGGCLIEKEHANGVDCGLDMCIECVKNWFSRE